jgi:hypothetical protein
MGQSAKSNKLVTASKHTSIVLISGRDSFENVANGFHCCGVS